MPKLLKLLSLMTILMVTACKAGIDDLEPGNDSPEAVLKLAWTGIETGKLMVFQQALSSDTSKLWGNPAQFEKIREIMTKAVIETIEVQEAEVIDEEDLSQCDGSRIFPYDTGINDPNLDKCYMRRKVYRIILAAVHPKEKNNQALANKSLLEVKIQCHDSTRQSCNIYGICVFGGSNVCEILQLNPNTLQN